LPNAGRRISPSCRRDLKKGRGCARRTGTRREAFASFIARLRLPRRLADVGIGEDRFELIGKNAMLSIFTRSNPQPIRAAGDVIEILKLAA
jgi:alcohol dehydrogenase class IV